MIVSLAWLIPALPAVAFLVIAACFVNRRAKWAPWTLIIALGGSLAFSLAALAAVLNKAGGVAAVSWVAVGQLEINVGTLIDPLSAAMLAVVSLVSLLIQIYSIGYMADDPGYGPYFAYMALFSASMLGLVISSSLLQMYLFWELVGLCSYLLIGFWYRKPEAASAAKKAFVVTRFGDVGFLIAIIWLSTKAGTFDFVALEAMIKTGALAGAGLTWIALLIFSGAVGKSAQFPLHVWLPDAMEGPTPVSALIHAATMVAAGVYLVARTYPIFEVAPYALDVVAIIGGITAFLAASIAIAQDDIKRVLAYSTISQLGYMMLALGVGGYYGGVFHLVTHAFFKALLFLCAGSVIHALSTNNLREMGGLLKPMPVTAYTCLAGALALCGVPPFSGFFSKDAVLAAAFFAPPGEAAVLRNIIHIPLFLIALAVVFMTAFYMFRLWFLAFWGAPWRRHEHPAHESPKRMTVPLIILATLSVVAGAALSHRLAGFLGREYGEHGLLGYLVMALSTMFALVGIFTAWVAYGWRSCAIERFEATRFYGFLRNKWYIDQGYGWFVGHVVLAGALVFAWIDRHIVNGFVDGLAWLSGRVGRALRYVETGQLQFYALVIFIAVVLAILALDVFNVQQWVLFGLRSPGGLLGPTGVGG
jgi:NADH-quinone oxidoreductase subunit L